MERQPLALGPDLVGALADVRGRERLGRRASEDQVRSAATTTRDVLSQGRPQGLGQKREPDASLGLRQDLACNVVPTVLDGDSVLADVLDAQGAKLAAPEPRV